MKRLKGKRLIYAVVAIFLMVGYILMCYGPPRFWGDFTGVDEATVIRRLGTPIYDSRKDPPTYMGELSDEYEQGTPFTLGRGYGAMRLGLHFQDSLVNDQSRRVK